MSSKFSFSKDSISNTRIDRGKRIKQVRQELNMTQIDVSQEFGISKGMVSEYENGKYEPPANLVLGLSRKSGRNIVWIMTGEGPEYDDAIKPPSLVVKDKQTTEYRSKLDQVIEYLKQHPDLLDSIWQLIQGREGLKKFEKGE